MKYRVDVGDRTHEVEIDGERVLVDGKVVDAWLSGPPGSAIRRLHRGRAASRLLAAPGEGRGAWSLALGGCRLAVQVLDARGQAIRTAAAREGGTPRSGTLKAPMPGLVVRVLVAEGAQVEAGQGLIVLEAMKMENELKAAGSGTVRKVHVTPGVRVEKGAALVEVS